MIDRARAVPAWGWLAAIVVLSFALRAWLARGIVAPFIMVDELIYSELARSLAAGDGFQVRGAPAGGFSLVYPVLISPAYALFDALPDAYAAVKTLNSLLMSLAAVPAYFLARRVVAPPLALLAAVLAVALPSLAYTGTVMTENVFYPLFLTTALVLVLVLERPTLGRQALLLALVGLAFATRVQAVAFVPALLAGPFLLALLGRRPLRAELGRFRVLYGVVAAGALLVVAAQALRGRSLSDLLGAYSIVGDRSYDTATVARFFLYHLAELDLYLGVLPFAAFLLLTLLARRDHPDLAPFLAAGIGLTTSVLLVVAAFASEFANRIQERNTFVVAPFFLIALLAWVERGLPRPRVAAAAVAVAAALLPLTIPFERFIETAAISDTLAFLPIWDAYGSLLFDSVYATVLAGGALAAALFLLVPRPYALALPAATLVFMAAVSHNVWRGEYGFATARVSAGALFEGIRVGHRDWIDRALPDGATAAFVWTGITDRFAVNQNEFFNRAVGPIYYIGGPTPGGLAEAEVTIDEETGEIRTVDGRAVEADYVLTEDSITPDGEVLARDPGIGITLREVAPPLVATETQIEGLYPGDTWSGREVTWTQERCRGGTLVVGLSSDPNLYDEDQIVTAFVGGERAGRVRIAPPGTAELRVRTVPEGGTCRVVFRVARTKVPGGGDDRELGAHFDTFFHTR
ncbi:MAG TPA: glycosyltransferase family 39 protein [Gaiellaceae bacterium]|nr:glycosyltransferase family 39 protein [Gaiellaceae bacterium]